jgi:hypothetical protein
MCGYPHIKIGQTALVSKAKHPGLLTAFFYGRKILVFKKESPTLRQGFDFSEGS